MYFKRKAYDKLIEWKLNYAVLLEGARRIGKTTIAKLFAENEYKSYILIDFSIASTDILSCFDEVQLFPRARQAIKHLVKDGRYHYIETGSLISIKKNVKDILIPSEEMKITVYSMDYEEFCNATGNNYHLIKQLFDMKKAVGQEVNRKLMRDMRIYMAVGGMPQAVEAYVNGNNFSTIDNVKRQIIYLYEEDFKKIDPSGKISALYHSIPAQLAKGQKNIVCPLYLKREKEELLLFDLFDSKTVLPCYNSTDSKVSLSSSKDINSYKLYLSDTGLFVTLMFIDRPITENEIYAKLLSDKLPANLGYLYENLMAQLLASKDRELYYHTWQKENSTHYYEIDFLISEGSKISAIEVKSSGLGKHDSLCEFAKKYSKHIKNCYIFSQKDYKQENGIQFMPIYLAPFI